MATVPYIENNTLTKEASKIIKSIRDEIILSYEDYIIEDVSKTYTSHYWRLYLITLKDGIEIPRVFHRERGEYRDKNNKIIKYNDDMKEFEEIEEIEHHLEIIHCIKHNLPFPIDE